MDTYKNSKIWNKILYNAHWRLVYAHICSGYVCMYKRRQPHHADLHARFHITQGEAIFFEIIQLPRKLNHSMVYILLDVFANSQTCRYIRCYTHLLLPLLSKVILSVPFCFTIWKTDEETMLYNALLLILSHLYSPLC